jgi:ribonuclease R
MRDLLRILKTRRLQEGSIDFDMDEVNVRIAPDGNIETIERVKRGDAERMIEEFMLLANKVVAKHLEENKIPAMFRIHDIPEVIKIDTFNNIVRPLNMGCVNLNSINPQAFQTIISRTRDNEHEKLINLMVLRTMQAAKYSAENIGHFGLSFKHYTHFTSPIRRYPDLIVHRLIRHLLLSKKSHRKPPYSLQEMRQIAEHSSIAEKNAVDIERYYLKLKQIRFLKHRIGKVFDGIITGVCFNGVFVELVDFPVEGLVPKSLMMDDYYIFDEKQNIFVGRKSHKVLMLGKRIRVKVAKVDDTRFFADFESVEL